jgi:hypothetical protein
MVDVYLIVMVSIVAVLLLVVCTLILIYYGHPDDSMVAKVPKIVTVT